MIYNVAMNKYALKQRLVAVFIRKFGEDFFVGRSKLSKQHASFPVFFFGKRCAPFVLEDRLFQDIFDRFAIQGYKISPRWPHLGPFFGLQNHTLLAAFGSFLRATKFHVMSRWLRISYLDYTAPG